MKNEENLGRERKRRFIRAIAEYISGDAGRKSIDLEMCNKYANEWARVRGASPILCTTDIDETEKQLREYFGIK